MADEITIYGKDSCPYTQAALEDCRQRSVPFRYVNVKKNPAELDKMLALTKGRRQVPVIVEQGRVTIGFGGT